MNCIITGASGFIGKNLISNLDSNKFNLALIGKLYNLSKENYFAENYLEFDKYDSFLKSADAIVHLAHSTRPSSDNLNQDINENLLGTMALASRCESGSHFVYASTGGAMYGDTTKSADEAKCPNPLTYYAAGKLAAEKYLEVYCKKKGINLTILRITNPYGLGIDLSKGVGAINTFVKNLKIGAPITVWGDGKTERDYIHVNDVSNAIKICLEKRIYGLYNVSHGKSYKLNHIIEIISKKLNITPVIHYLPERTYDMRQVRVSNQKLIKASGWTPEISLEDGISNLIIEKI